MKQSKNKFSAAELEAIDKADDLKIAPFRKDGVSYGTPTWIWNVVVDGNLYVRAYNGKNSRWHQSAVQQKAGRINAAGTAREVIFEAADGNINEQIDEAYKAKYNKSQYMAHMIGSSARAATIIMISPL